MALDVSKLLKMDRRMDRCVCACGFAQGLGMCIEGQVDVKKDGGVLKQRTDGRGEFPFPFHFSFLFPPLSLSPSLLLRSFRLRA